MSEKVEIMEEEPPKVKMYICAGCQKKEEFEGNEAHRGKDVYCIRCQEAGNIVPSKVIPQIKDFQMAVERKGITVWLIRTCGGCNYPLSYNFRHGAVTFDAGCDCTNSCNIHPRSWHEIKEQYDIQTHWEAIKRYDEFFGFYETEAIEEYRKIWDARIKYYVFPLHQMTPTGRQYIAVRKDDGFELKQFYSSNDDWARQDGCIEGMEMEFISDPSTPYGQEVIKNLNELRGGN